MSFLGGGGNLGKSILGNKQETKIEDIRIKRLKTNSERAVGGIL